MRKPKNPNVSAINKYFDWKMSCLATKLSNYGVGIWHYKKILSGWYDSLYRTEKGSDEAQEYLQLIEISSRELCKLKTKRKIALDEYTEIKRMKKTVQRAIEERWMNGFAEGVDFVNECLDENLKVKYNE